ncbi:hypothetical protein BGX30_013035 [Mortierella sp. GBA39]|nr:hypothetical protein BGX30_013035 [Mortierella sp. GBA39]
MAGTSHNEKQEYTDAGSIIDDDKAIHRSGGPTENEQFGLGFGLGFGYAFQRIISVTTEVTSAGRVDPFVEDVIAVFAGAPVYFFSTIGWKIYHKTKLVPLLEVDLNTGRPTIIQGISVDRSEDEDEDKEREAQLPRWKRAGLKVFRFIA